MSITIKTAYNRLSAFQQALSVEGMADICAPIVHHSLEHGQVKLANIKALRMDNNPRLKTLKSALIKHLPVKWDKVKEQYEFDSAKRATLQEQLAALKIKTDVESLTTHFVALFTVEDEPKAEPTKDEQIERKSKSLNNAVSALMDLGLTDAEINAKFKDMLVAQRKAHTSQAPEKVTATAK